MTVLNWLLIFLFGISFASAQEFVAPVLPQWFSGAGGLIIRERDPADVVVVGGKATSTTGYQLEVLGGVLMRNFVATSSSNNSGIGTTTPGAMFSVQGPALITGPLTSGAARATSSLQVDALAGVGCAQWDADGRITNTGSACGTGGSGGASHFATSSTDSTAIHTIAQLVGIGTSTPGTMLSVNGAGAFTGSVTATVFKATSTTDASLFAGGVTITCTGCLTDANVADTVTLTNITQVTTRPITSLTTSAAAGSVFFSDGTNPTTDTNLTFSAADDRLTTLFASSTSLSLSNLLNVSGIGTSTFTGSLTAGTLAVGTSSPSALYGTNLSGRFLMGGEGTSTINGEGTALGGLRIKGNLLIDGGIEFTGGCKGCPAGGGAGTPGGSDTQIQYNNGGAFGGATLFTFDDTAGAERVGIGTTTPGAMLSVHGPVLFGNGTTTALSGLITPSISATSSLGFYTNGLLAPRMYIAPNGNIGISTTSPGAKFSVNGEGLFGGRLLANFFQATSTSIRSLFAGGAEISSSLLIPSAADPTVNETAEFALNTTAASSSPRYYNGTTELASYPTRDKSIIVASSTLYQIASYKSDTTGTTTLNIANHLRPVTIMAIYCETDVGTVAINFHDGTNRTDTLTCNTAGARDDGSIANSTWVSREDFKLDVGNGATNTNIISITLTIREDAD